MIALLASFFLSLTLQACDFLPEVKGVYSLSGSVTLALRDLGLIGNPKLKGVSIFHPLGKNKFKGTFFPGGIFLSHETIKNLSGNILFYDESRELTRVLARYEGIKAIQIKTRALSPLEVAASMEASLRPFLKGCELGQLTRGLEQKLNILKNSIPKNITILFFLGLIQFEKYPELLMVNDGVVKWMTENHLLKSYPSELNYVNWSSRIMQGLPGNSTKVGIKDSGSDLTTKIEKTSTFINLTYPGALIPGVGQVDAMIHLFKNL